MKLIIINGPCGAGKSTLAENIHARMPLSVLIGVDELRRNISQYRENRKESGFLSFELALGVMEKAFENRKDVIIERIMFDYPDAPKDYLQELFTSAEKYNVQVSEIILTAKKEVIIDRVKRRGLDEKSLLTLEKAERFCDEMEVFMQKRKDAVVIDVDDMTENDVFETAWKIINKN